LKFSKRRRAVPLRPIWTIMVVAKLDQSRVLVTKFRQNRLTLKVKVPVSHTDRQTDRQTSRWVFTARLRPQFRRPSSEYPQFGMPPSFDRSALVIAASTRCWRRAHSIGRGSRVHTPYLRYGDRGRLQNVSLPSVLFESSRIFLQYTGGTDAKMMDQNFELRIL